MNNGIMNNEFTFMKFANLYELHGKGLLTKWCMQETVLIRIVEGTGYDIIQVRYKICLKFKSWNRQLTIKNKKEAILKWSREEAVHNMKQCNTRFTIRNIQETILR